MSSSETIAFLVAAAILAFGGLIFNGFIVTVITIEWTKSRSLSSIELLLLTLGLSNFWSSVLLTPFYINEYAMRIFSDLMLQILFFINVFLAMSRFWFTAWLCVFYCIKIMNNTQKFFLWCKLRISWLIPRFLVGSLVFSFIPSFLASRNIWIQLQKNTTKNFTNMTQRKELEHTLGALEIIFVVLGASGPLLVVLLCSILVVTSLCRHSYRRMDKESNLRSPQTEACIKAAGTVLSLLFLYASFYLTHTLSMVVDLRIKKNPHFITLVFIAYPPAQATILLLSNPKLKQAAAWMMQRRKP
ncbi:taste receptor type 2 member 40-like [Sceloporus undulatus]|uniref:taste receptor type 2 member 40-like n=1 Tax=Sceloporus undulatus TaxID=8520 RepID=UPI001C4A7F0D|nr:taste receptor type 2 member 40-like [Sceloporus undulatus]